MADLQAFQPFQPFVPGRRRFMRRLTLGTGLVSLATAVPAAGLTADVAAGGKAPMQRVERRGFAFGTQVRVVAVHRDPDRAVAAADAALIEISSVDALLSVQLAGSRVAQLNTQGQLGPADPRLLDALRAALSWSQATGGAFDVSVQPLWQVFEAARNRQQLPDDADVREALRRVGWRDVVIDGAKVSLRRDGAALTLNGISQGFAADRALAVLQAHQVTAGLIDSGEFQALGTDPQHRRWRLGVRHPRHPDRLLATLALRDRAVSSSGDYEYGFSPDRRHHHIFDPRTGYSPRQLAAVTVIAPNATDADAMSTALMVLGAQAGRQLVAQHPGSSALFVDKAGRLTTAGSEIATILR